MLVNLLSLLLDEEFEALHLVLIEVKLLPKSRRFDLQIIYLLLHKVLVLFQLRAHSLETLLIIFLIHVHLTVVIDLYLQFITLFLDLFHRLVRQFQLMCQMVDVSLQGLDLSDVILLFLLEFLDHELRPAHILLHIEALLVKLIMIIRQLFDCLLVPFIL